MCYSVMYCGDSKTCRCSTQTSDLMWEAVVCMAPNIIDFAIMCLCSDVTFKHKVKHADRISVQLRGRNLLVSHTADVYAALTCNHILQMHAPHGNGPHQQVLSLSTTTRPMQNM